MIGRDHRLIPKNNQDSWTIQDLGNTQFGIVADGCGSGAHSEVGARLGVQMLSKCFALQNESVKDFDWSAIETRMLMQLEWLLPALADNRLLAVQEQLLFTLLGVVFDDQTAAFFALGDGTIIVNGEALPLGRYPGNAPPYLGYRLISEVLTIDPGLVKLTPILEVPTAQIDSFLIATDGIDDFIKNAQNYLPGTDTLVGTVDQFWQNDRYFRGNPELVSRQLKLVGRDWPLHDPHPGLLSDDTTLIVGRRSPNCERGQT